MRELSVVEQRYEAVRAVISDGETVTDVTARFGVARKTVHAWLAPYEAGGLEGLADRSHRLRSCPHQERLCVVAALGSYRPQNRGERTVRDAQPVRPGGEEAPPAFRPRI